MSRIRSTHPGLWTDERFVSVEPLARLLFMGIWNECDDQGYFEWSPLKLKMRLLPADNADASALLACLEAAGCVLKFTVGAKTFGAVRNFTKYQRPKKPNAVYPTTEEAAAFASGNAEAVPHQFPTSGEIPPQREEGGDTMEEKDPPKPPRKRRGEGKHLLPEDWELPSVENLPPKAKACAEQWTKASYETHGEAFVNYWRGERKMKADWVGTWGNRIIDLHSKVMRDQKFGNAPTDAAPAKPIDVEAYQARMAELDRKLGRDSDGFSKRGPPKPIAACLPKEMREFQAKQ